MAKTHFEGNMMRKRMSFSEGKSWRSLEKMSNFANLSPEITARKSIDQRMIEIVFWQDNREDKEVPCLITENYAMTYCWRNRHSFGHVIFWVEKWRCKIFSAEKRKLFYKKPLYEKSGLRRSETWETQGPKWRANLRNSLTGKSQLPKFLLNFYEALISIKY